MAAEASFPVGATSTEAVAERAAVAAAGEGDVDEPPPTARVTRALRDMLDGLPQAVEVFDGERVAEVAHTRAWMGPRPAESR